MKTVFFLPFILIIFSSCNPFKTEGELIARKDEVRIIDPIEAQKKLEEQKRKDWEKIVLQAKENFQDIRPIIKKKCFSCHDSNTKLPFYGKIFPKINIVYKHQRDGLRALDFKNIFPLKARGESSQLSLLRAIRSATLEKTMPLKSYLLFYPNRKIKKQDEVDILNWVEPLINEVQLFEDKYLVGNSLRSKAIRVFRNRCFRCHANGVRKGGFGSMENIKELIKSKYINKDFPEKSEIYTISLSGEMPPSKTEQLSEEELNVILDWLSEL